MNFVECYTRDQLQDFLLGRLADEKSDLVAQHLDHCEICEDTIVGLESTSDTFVDLLLDKDADLNREGPVCLDLAESKSESMPEFRAALRRIQNFDFDQVPARDVKPQVIQQIGEYEIGEQIAIGGMGSVYRARHMRLEKSVAIKVLPERKMQNGDAIARFSREMKIIGQMDHPSMVRATDAGDINGTHFLVMELVEGLDLGRIVRLCGRLAPENAAEVVRSAAIGLHYAHERDVVHRDVKPSNFMLNRDGAIKILDLGLATLGGLHGTVDELTTVGQLMGTLDYMAPEQCGNNHAVDSRTDVYGLGATLYKLLTGNAPYSNPRADTPLKKLKAMATENPMPILDRRPDLSPELAAVVDKCLEREPSNRFRTAYEVSVALEPFTTGHALKGVLNSAEKLNIQREEPNSSQTPEAIDVQPLNSIRKTRQSPHPTQITPRPSKRWIGKTVVSVTTILTAALLAWGGITIYLNTIAGQLIIESEIDNIRVSVVQNEKPTKQLQIEHGSKSTRLRAGKYQIEILGESDGLLIDKDRFELKRGEKVVVKITRRDPADKDSNTNLAITSDFFNSPEKRADVATQRKQMKLDELRNAVDVAAVKVEFATTRLKQSEKRYRAGQRPKDEWDQDRMIQQIAVLEYENAKQILKSYSNLPPDLSDFTATLKGPAKTKNHSDLDALRLDLIDLEHAVKVAAIRLDSAKQHAAKPSQSRRESIQDRTNFELAQLEYDSAKSRLSAAKEQLKNQAKNEKRDLEQQIEVAQEDLRQLEETLDRSKQLAQKGFITQSQVRADQFKITAQVRMLDTLLSQFDKSFPSASNSNAHSDSGPNSASPPNDTAAMDRQSRSKQIQVNEPTYQSKPIDHYLEFSLQLALTRDHPVVIRESVPAIKQLLPLISKRHLEKIFSDTISEYENEIALETQYRVIFSLALLCDEGSKSESGSLTNRLLDYVMAISSKIGSVNTSDLATALQPLTDSQFERVQQFLLSKYPDGNPVEKKVGLSWLVSLQRNTGANKFTANPAVSEKWVPLLTKDTQDENSGIGSFAKRVLTMHWGVSDTNN